MNIFNRAFRWLTLPLPGLCWLLCGLAWISHANASQRWEMLSDPAFQHISSEQGLPHGYISSMVQDKAGFLWIATTNGLTRWDGYRFHTYKPQINDNNSISDIVILALHLDPQGHLWIGTATGGLLRYETAQDSFTRFAIGPGGLSHPSVTSICDDGSGGLWLATGAGLNHLDTPSGKVTQMPRSEAKYGELPESRLKTVLRTRDGSVWVGSTKGLLQRPPGSLRFNPVKLPAAINPAGTPEVKQAISITSLFEASDKHLWIGTNNSGAFWYDFKDGKVHSLREINSSDPQIASDPINAMLEPHPGQLWFATLGRGILIVHAGSNETSRIMHNPMVPNSLSSNTIYSLMLDRSGLVWAGTHRGLEHIDSNNQAVHTLFGIENHPSKISNPNVRSILSLPDGTIWLGLFNNGIDIIHPERGRIRALRPDLKQPETALQDDRIWALLLVNNDTVFIGTDHGLYRAKTDGSELVRVKLPGPPVDRVRKLLLDGNNLYIGSHDGLFVLDLSGAAPLPRIRPKGAEKLSDADVSSMIHGPDGSIWIGTRNGLNQYNPVTHSLRMFLPNSKSGKGLAPGIITSLLFDRQGRLWIGSIGSGISVMTHNGKDAAFQRLGVFDGLPNDAINCMQPDDKGNIWISTDDGLAEVDPDQLQVRAIGRADGVVLSTYLSGSCHSTNQGELLFGATGGLTVLQPRLLQKWHFQPTLVISEIRIAGKTVPSSRFNQGTHTPTLMIPPNTDSLSLEFSALDFSAPEQNRYAYQLEGYDTDWIDTDPSRRLAVYTRLPPGDYRLRLRGSNRSGEWIGEELILPLHVTASWYQTWWFRMLELLAMLGLILSVIHIRTRYLQQNRKQLALQVAERTSELEQKQQELVRANQDLNNANDELAQSANTLRELDHIGRDITANLDLQTAFETVHQHVMRLLDAPSLIILRFNPELTQLELAFGREHGQPVASQGSIPLQSALSNNARTARERHEILIEVMPDPGNEQATRTSRKLMTALYVPLIVDHRLLGVMSMQSGLPQAYGPRERLIFRNLCAYTAIALDNANAYHRLQEAQEKLVEQEKLAALGALVAGVAHELNTPIGNSILMLSSMQSKTSEFGAKVNDGQLRRSELDEYLEDANEASRVIMRGLSSAADLVASFKQVAVDRTTAHQRPFNLANTSNEIIATMMNRIKLAGHQIELKMADDITLNSYPGPYGQVIANLINNALLHAFENQAQGRMWLSARKEGNDRVLIEFHDNGKGIAPDHLKRIFDPFFTTKMGQGGSGLGLSISYNIVTSLLNGSIRVESTPGKGTRFIMDLPLKAPLR